MHTRYAASERKKQFIISCKEILHCRKLDWSNVGDYTGRTWRIAAFRMGEEGRIGTKKMHPTIWLKSKGIPKLQIHLRSDWSSHHPLIMNLLQIEKLKSRTIHILQTCRYASRLLESCSKAPTSQTQVIFGSLTEPPTLLAVAKSSPAPPKESSMYNRGRGRCYPIKTCTILG